MATTNVPLPTGTTGPPFIIVQLNAKELIDETVQLISTVRDQVKTTSDSVNERLNGTMESVRWMRMSIRLLSSSSIIQIGTDLQKIVGNVEGITKGIKQQIEAYR